jgi:tryptophan 2,3-dioxygenase
MKRKRILSPIRTTELELALTREVRMSTSRIREETASKTSGQPLAEFGGMSNPYIDYLRDDLLHSLQHVRTEAYDELPFILMSQIKELLFRSLHYELANMQIRIREDDVAGALSLVPRLRRELELLAKCCDVLSTITPHGFNEFRDYLGAGSGLQSFAYRHVEFILGNKSRRMAAVHANNPDVFPAIQAALNSPSLYDDVIALLARRGLAMPAERLCRNWADSYTPHPAVEAAWLEVYKAPTPDNDLYRLAEALLEIDELFAQYRWRHFSESFYQRIVEHNSKRGGGAERLRLAHRQMLSLGA